MMGGTSLSGGVELGDAAVELVEPVTIGGRVEGQDLQDAKLSGDVSNPLSSLPTLPSFPQINGWHFA